MSATAESTPLGGFEERLLVQLKAQVAPQPASGPQPARGSRGFRLPRPSLGARVSLPAAAMIAALVTGVLSLLPAAPTLARAFPVLSGRTQALPQRLARVLGVQRLVPAGPHFDLRHAYAFHTPAGIGYVIADRRSRWLCILVPGLSSDTAAGRCERVTLATAGRPPLTLRISDGHHRQEIVALLPRGATASATTAAGGAVALKIRRGVAAIVAHGPVTLTTTVGGHRSTAVTYTP